MMMIMINVYFQTKSPHTYIHKIQVNFFVIYILMLCIKSTCRKNKNILIYTRRAVKVLVKKIQLKI